MTATLLKTVMSKLLLVPVVNLSVHMLQKGGTQKWNDHIKDVHIKFHKLFMRFQTNTPLTQREEPVRITYCDDAEHS